jgi:hypothetical protein
MNDNPSVNVNKTINKIGRYSIVHGGTKWNRTINTPKAHRSNSIIINVVMVVEIGIISLGK